MNHVACAIVQNDEPVLLCAASSRQQVFAALANLCGVSSVDCVQVYRVWSVDENVVLRRDRRDLSTWADVPDIGMLLKGASRNAVVSQARLRNKWSQDPSRVFVFVTRAENWESALVDALRIFLLAGEEHPLINAVCDRVEDLLETVPRDPVHDFNHFSTVESHAKKALKLEPKTSRETELKVRLAALLHDVDDKKVFPEARDFDNAVKIMRESVESLRGEVQPRAILTESFILDVVEMIDLVSCSKQEIGETSGSREHWRFIPRDSDRLEAIGQIGVTRCVTWSANQGRPMFTDQTPRALDDKELDAILSTERYEEYKRGKRKSASTIDHFYDKLLHIGKPQNLESNNAYILEEARSRDRHVRDFVIEFWKGQ